MSIFFTLLRLEIKKALKLLPPLFFRTVVVAILVIMSIYLLQMTFFHTNKVEKIHIGMVAEDQTQEITLLATFVSSMESVQNICDMDFYEKSDAEKKLKCGYLQAVIYMPRTMIEDILTGVNTPAVISFADENSVNTAVFQELADSGASLLSTAQAAIYALDTTLVNYQIQMTQREMEEYISRIYIRPVLSRNTFFESEVYSAFGEKTMEEYYLCIATILIALVSVHNVGKIYHIEDQGVEIQLKRHGMGEGQVTLCRSVANGMLFFFLFLTMTGVMILFDNRISVLEVTVSVSMIFQILILSCVMGAFIHLIFIFGRDSNSGCILLFFFTIMMFFFAGGILPLSYMPNWIRIIGRKNPFLYWQNFLGNAWFQQNEYVDYMAQLIMLFLFVGSSMLIMRRDRKNG